MNRGRTSGRLNAAEAGAPTRALGTVEAEPVGGVEWSRLLRAGRI